MRIYNAKLPVGPAAVTIADIQRSDNSPIDIASFGTRSLLLQPVDGDIIYTFDTQDPVAGIAQTLKQGERLEVQAMRMVDLRIIGTTATQVAVECRYLRDRGIPRHMPVGVNQATTGLPFGLPFSLGGP